MSNLEITLLIITTVLGLPAAIFGILKLIDRFKKKYKIVEVGFTYSPDFPEEKGCIYEVPYMIIEKYDNELLQIREAEIIFKDRDGKNHRFGAALIEPNEIIKTARVKLYDFFFEENFWKEILNDIYVTKRATVTFQIKNGKGKTTRLASSQKTKDRKAPKSSPMGSYEVLDDNMRPTGVKGPIRVINQSRDIVPVIDVDFSEVLSGSTINGKIEKGELIKINGVSYKISFANYEEDKAAQKCPTCSTRLPKIFVRTVQYPPSARNPNVVFFTFRNWCPKCNKED